MIVPRMVRTAHQLCDTSQESVASCAQMELR
jgi:hypothetical protein